MTVQQLFCGSDDFSKHSLYLLDVLRQRKPTTIESIDVLCRTDKPVERGLKQRRAPPIKGSADSLQLPIHQIDTFRGWQPPKDYNLVIAVSFGLLVPARILNAATYGGLNIHPSMLPDLRGSAPVVHALLKRRTETGVSLQTMHPTKFDHGTVLAQAGGITIHNLTTPNAILNQLAPLGAELLCEAIDEGLFVPPLRDLMEGKSVPQQLDLAPKIAPADRHIDWQSWTADEILLRERALGDLWDTQTFSRCGSEDASGDDQTHVTFHGPWMKAKADVPAEKAGEPFLAFVPYVKGRALAIKTVDGHVVAPHSATIEGKKKGKGLQALNERLRWREMDQRDEAGGRDLAWTQEEESRDSTMYNID